MMRFSGLGMLAGGFIGLLIAIVISAIAVLAIIALVRYIRHTGRHGHEMGPMSPMGNANSSLQILDERFARGEINEEEYTKKKELLRK